jgi:hypothetical protein
MEERPKHRFHVTRRMTRVALALAPILLLICGVYAFVTFTQYFPSVPAGVVAPNLLANCGVSSMTALTATPATVIEGAAFAIVYSCPSGTAAISVSNGPINTIPTEAPAVGAAGMPITLSLIAPGVTCTASAGIAFAQSTAVNIPTGDYNYCATGTTAPAGGVVSFTVTWA